MSARLKKISFYCFLLFLLFLIASPFLATWAINSNSVKTKVESFIAQKTNYSIHIKDFSVVFFPRPTLKINDLNYAHSDISVAKIDAITIGFNLIKLLHGEFIIEQARLEHPVINFPQIINASDKKTGFDFDLSKIFDLKHLFSYLPESQNHIEIVVNNLVSSYFERMDCSLLFSKENSKIVLNTSIDRLKLHTSDIDPLLSTSFFNFETIEIDKLNLFTTLDSELKINGRCVFNALKIKKDSDEIVFKTNIIETFFKRNNDSYSLEIPSFKTQLPHATLGVRFQSDKDVSSIQFTGADINLGHARHLALNFLAKNAVTDTLFEIIQGGTSPKIEVSFQSKEFLNLFDENNLILNGVIQHGVVNIPETNLTATSVFGNASVKHGILQIQTTDGRIQHSIIKKGNLSVDLLNSIDYPFHGKFLLDVNLANIPKTLITLLPDTLLARELERVHDVTGRCTAWLTLSLPSLAPDLVVNVKADDFSISGEYDRIPDKIVFENISFQYEPDTITINNAIGQISKNTITDLHTIVNLKNDVRIQTLSGSASISLKETIPWLRSYEKTREMISPVVDGAGTLLIEHLNLSGPVLTPEKWKFDAQGTGNKIEITTHLDKKEISGLAFGYIVKNDQFKLHDISMAPNNYSWLDAELKPGYIDAFSPSSLNEGHFFSDKDNCTIKGKLEFPGNASISFDLQGKKHSSMALKSIFIKDSNLSNATIRFIDKDENFPFNFRGTLDTKTISKIFNTSSTLIKTIDTVTNGESVKIQSDTASQIQIRSNFLDLNALFSHLKSFSPEKSSLPNTAILFQANTVKYNTLKFSNIDSKILLSPNDLYIRINKGHLCGIKTTGYINLKNNIVFASFPFLAKSKKNIQDLLSCIFEKENFMDGQYSLDCNISSSSTPENIKKKIKGDLKFIAREGRIYKLTLLSRILSVLNVSNVFRGKIPDITQTGFAYKNIIFEADVEDSVIYLNKAIIDGRDMTLIFKGTIDPLNDKINMTCLVAPFKTVDLIIEKIPIVNTLLGGRLVSVPVQATGKLSDPTVIPLHPSAVGKGLVDMMTDILKTPVKLMDKIIK